MPAPAVSFSPTDHFSAICGTASESNFMLDHLTGSDNAGNYYSMEVNTAILTEAGISCGDTIIVSRNKAAVNNCIVVVNAGGDFLIRKLAISGGKAWLSVPGASLAPLEVSNGVLIWGVVIYVVRKLVQL